MKKYHIFIPLVFIFISILSGCADTSTATKETETVYQVSTLNALMLGYYDGIVTVGELLENGDTGLGTFDTLDGEMILLDGVVYQAKADGSVEIQSNDTTVPFCAVTFFEGDIALDGLADLGDIEAIKAVLDEAALTETGNANLFYFAKITGDFAMVHVRSVPAQEKPYLTLAEIAASQPEFIYENISGAIVAVRCPDYVEGINMPGWHLHFISDDGTKGGHLLDASLVEGAGQIDITTAFTLELPEDESFGALDLRSDLQEETKQVEGKSEE